MLAIVTQGRSRREAYAMAKDAIESAIAQEGFEVSVSAGDNDTFTVASNDDALLLALALRQLRASRGLSVRAVANRMGSSSPTAYSAYESGKRKPSFEKFTQLLKAIDARLEPVLTLGSAASK